MLKLKEHAVLRMTERSSITEQELIGQLTDGKYIKVGEEPKSYRAHWLFYQPREQLWYVAVVDERTEEIITLLPPDYRGAFAMDMDLLEEAKELTEEKPRSRQADSTAASAKKSTTQTTGPSEATHHQQPTVYKLTAATHDPDTHQPILKHVSSYPIKTGDPRIDLKTQEFCQHVLSELVRKGIKEEWEGVLLVKLKKSIEPAQIPLWLIYAGAKHGV